MAHIGLARLLRRGMFWHWCGAGVPHPFMLVLGRGGGHKGAECNSCALAYDVVCTYNQRWPGALPASTVAGLNTVNGHFALEVMADLILILCSAFI